MHILRATALALALCALAPAVAGAGEAITEDGLVPIKVKHIDKAWKRPDASLAGYDRILLRPVSVAFAKHWNPRDYGRFGLKSDEVERIRTGLSKLAGDTFTRVLTRGGYQVVTTPGENVLEVEAQIVDLYVNGPEIHTGTNVRTYVLSAGEMRLLVTLRDAVTGTALYRASDFRRGAETGRLEWATDVFNASEAELALAGWARRLKDALDAARAD